MRQVFDQDLDTDRLLRAIKIEIDFLIQSQGKIVPIEVKAEENLKAKSLKVFIEKYRTPPNIRTSLSNYREDEWLTNLPLYGIHTLISHLKSIK